MNGLHRDILYRVLVQRVLSCCGIAESVAASFGSLYNGRSADFQAFNTECVRVALGPIAQHHGAIRFGYTC